MTQEMTTVALVNTHAELFEKGETLGLSGSFILELLHKFGPDLLRVLLALRQEKVVAEEKPGPHIVGAVGLDLFNWKRLLAMLLSQHRDEIMEQFDKLEVTLLDKVIEYLNQ